jgi:hypothetical protein
LEVAGQQLHPGHAVLLCRVAGPGDWCRACGCLGVPRDSVLCRLAHVPPGWRATILHVRIRRYRCPGCGQVWRQDTTAAVASGAKLSTQAVLRALKSVVTDRMPIARIAAGPWVSWHTVNDAVLAAGRQLLIAGPTRFDGGQVPGVDEHAWRHTRRGDKFVTVARKAALTEAQFRSPLGRRPYDLRHAAVSLWLNFGVPATEVARRAGHGVAVLLKIYAHCIDGQADAANRRITGIAMSRSQRWTRMRDRRQGRNRQTRTTDAVST